MNNMFVYGTLKKGYGANNLMTDRQGKYLGKATIKGYKLYDLGGFPCIVPSDNPFHSVIGEVYQVDDISLNRIDAYEGVSTGLFERSSTTPVFEHDGSELSCFIYQWGQDEAPQGSQDISGTGAAWARSYAKNR